MKLLTCTVAVGAVLWTGMPVWALGKYSDWARNQITGANISNATIKVYLAGTTTFAALYDNQGAAVSNPFQANSVGFFEVLTTQGSYDVHVFNHPGTTELYVIPNLLLFDPQGAAVICSNGSSPALTTEQIPADHPDKDGYDYFADHEWARQSTVAFQLDRRDSSGGLIGKPWYLVGYRAEQSLGFEFNTFGRPTYEPTVPGPISNAAMFNSDTADFGLFGLADLIIDWHDGGLVTVAGPTLGLWLTSTAGTTVSVDMPVSGTTPTVGDVVALSPTAPGQVARTTLAAARAPFVVTSVQSPRATVAVAGVASVKVNGPIAVGDLLGTSTVAGYAAKVAVGVSAPSILGSALDPLATGSGSVRVRIGMVAQ